MTRYTYTTTDEAQAQRWLRASDLCHVLSEYDNELRNVIKHDGGRENLTAGVEWARAKLHEYLADNDISMDRLWE
jgi:hypothetical protein